MRAAECWTAHPAASGPVKPLAQLSAISYHYSKANRRGDGPTGDGAAMRLLIALFLLAVLAAATASLGMEFWSGRIGHPGASMRAIHYDTNSEMSAQRRMPAR
jgi:hypothetical protein